MRFPRQLEAFQNQTTQRPRASSAPQLDEDVSLSRDVLNRLGWKRLVATRIIYETPMKTLLATLRKEDIAHSWKNFPVENDVRSLLAWENATRPTTIFSYYAVLPDGRPEIVAAASVGECVRLGEEPANVPVLARCYVRPQYRRLGIYQSVIQHRIEFCRQMWGSELRGIHSGSNHPAVWRVLARTRLEGAPFFHVGNEHLVLEGGDKIVRGFFWFSKSFRKSLVESAIEFGKPTKSKALEQSFRSLFRSDKKPNHYAHLVKAFTAVRSEFPQKSDDPLGTFFGICQSVPLALNPKVRAK